MTKRYLASAMTGRSTHPGTFFLPLEDSRLLILFEQRNCCDLVDEEPRRVGRITCGLSFPITGVLVVFVSNKFQLSNLSPVGVCS